MRTFEQGFRDELVKLAAKFKLKVPKVTAPKGEAASPLTKIESPSKGVGIKKFYVGK